MYPVILRSSVYIEYGQLLVPSIRLLGLLTVFVALAGDNVDNAGFVVVSLPEVPGNIKLCHLGPVVLGDVLALALAALTLPAAANPSVNATSCSSAASVFSLF